MDTLPAPLDAIPLTEAEYAFVTAPMILHGRGGGWESDVPTWVRTQLPQARLWYLCTGGNPNLACYFDVMPYLMTASLEMPLSSEMTRIFLYVSFTMIQSWGQGFASLPDETWVRDALTPLLPYEQTLLDDLRGDIRAGQIKHLKKASANAKRRTKKGEE
jgi:hypothetical protein